MNSFDNFVAIDLETTGLDPSNCEIIELGAARYENGLLVESISQLVKPRSGIPNEITRLTGINDDMVEGAPQIEQVIKNYSELLGKSPWIVGHNIGFDLGFLKRVIDEATMKELDRNTMDTGVLARILLPRLQKYSLGSLVSHFRIERDRAHRALSDCKATAEIYLRLIRKLGELPVSSSDRVGRILFSGDDFHRFKQAIGEITVAEPAAEIETILDIESSDEDYFPDNTTGKTPATSYDDYIELNEAAIENHFLPGGVFSRDLENYEYRPMQAEMATKIAGTFNRSEFLMAEAATGVGKSIAYLLPAAWWASLNGERVIVSTQTKNLQSQLFYKDIPQIANAVGFDFKASLLKGRGNYLCLYKYHEFLAEAETSLSKGDRADLAALTVWIEKTKTGDISECHGFSPGRSHYIWSRISCEGSFCLGQSCVYAKECFLLKIRREVAASQIVIINHHLAFADFASGGELIRESGHIIFDEAHNLEKIAALYMGNRLEKRAIDGALADMYSSRPTQSGFLVNLRLAVAGYAPEWMPAIENVIDSIIALGHTSSSFFERLTKTMKNRQVNSEGREVRINESDNPCDLPERDELLRAFENLSGRLEALIDLVRESDDFPRRRDNIVRLESFMSDITRLARIAADLLFASDIESVYWIDLPSSARFSPTICSAPLEVGKLLDQKFYDYLKTAVFTSATLTVKGSFDYFSERMGLNLGSKERTLSICLDSPFDIDSEVAVISTPKLPSPKAPNFETEAFGFLEKILLAGASKSMVLFTSYKSLKNAEDYLAKSLETAGINLYTQQGSYNSERILRRFKSSSKAVLFGSDTFWEGVDLPGDLLELLVIFKLPFTVPDRPWFKANLEKIERDGKSSFAQLSLPDAVVRFRQGFGRLIRTADDRGCVVILDSRAARSSFGSHFIKSVRGTKFDTDNSDQAARIIRNWLRI